MKKYSVLFLAVAVIAVVFGWYQWQRAEATEDYGFAYVQHVMNVIDSSALSQANKDALADAIFDGAPTYEGVSLDFSDSSAMNVVERDYFRGRWIIRSGRR